MRLKLKEPDSAEDAPEESIHGATTTFKKVQLRLLMQEREDAVSKLVKLDYTIWTLEECFRAGGGEATLSSVGTSVPEGSLSS